MTTRTAEQQSELDSRIKELFNHQICFNEFLGFSIESIDSFPVKINFDMRPELVGHFLYGRLHGGVISSVLDVAGGLAIMVGIANNHLHENADEVMVRFANLATIDLRVDYLRQGIGTSFTASSEIVRLGKRVGVTHSSLRNEEGIQIATGSASYIVS